MQPAARFRKRPVVVEAMPFDGTREGTNALLAWMGANGARGASYRPGIGRIFIPTLEGVMEASPGDWMVKGVTGEFYPVKPHIFAQTYEPVESDS